MAAMYDILLQLPIFQGVSTEQMTHILEVSRLSFDKHKKKQVINEAGDQCLAVTFLVSGFARQICELFNGELVLEELYEAPQAFYLDRLFGVDTHCPSKLVAESPITGTMQMSKKDLLRLLSENDVPLINAMNILSSRSQRQFQSIEFLVEDNPVQRMASFLIGISAKGAMETVLKGKTEIWCKIMNIDKKTFRKIVAYLEESGAVEMQNDSIKLLDRYALQTNVSNKTTQKY